MENNKNLKRLILKKFFKVKKFSLNKISILQILICLYNKKKFILIILINPQRYMV